MTLDPSHFPWHAALLCMGLTACSQGPDPITPCTHDCTNGVGGSGGSEASGPDGASSGGAATVCPEGSGGTAPAIDVPLDSSTDAAITEHVHLNHLGYLSSGSKRVVVTANDTLTSFQVVQSSDRLVRLAGELEEATGFSAWGATDRFFVADFTTLREAGTFVLRVNGHDSETFEIRDGLYLDETLADVIGYFRGSRADDTAVWNADAAIPRVGGGPDENVQGGWYDASGDISKYLSHLTYSNYLNPQQIPLVAYALAWAHDEASAALDSRGQASAARDEALWGADYLVRSQADSGYFFATVFDGWSGDLSAREICAFEGETGTKTAEYQAAFREGGGLAIAALARIASWKQDGALTSQDYLDAATTGFSHLTLHNLDYVNDGQENVIDDYAALLAATELLATTGDTTYRQAARERARSLTARLSAEGYFVARGTRPFWHASDAGLPVLALVRYAETETDADARKEALDAVRIHLDYLVDVTNAVPNPYGYARQHVNVGATVLDSFFIPHENETGYWWQGENARLASLAAAAFIGGRALSLEEGCQGRPTEALVRYAHDQLDWILGKNPFDISFLSGTGRNNPPSYCAEKAPYHGHLAGGISNGITGQGSTGSGIQWRSGAPAEECWRDWRWVEQWLPHSAWYLIAITAASRDDG